MRTKKPKNLGERFMYVYSPSTKPNNKTIWSQVLCNMTTYSVSSSYNRITCFLCNIHTSAKYFLLATKVCIVRCCFSAGKNELDIHT